MRWAAVKQTAVVAHWIRVFLLLRVPIHADNVVVIDESGWKKSEVCDLSCIVARRRSFSSSHCSCSDRPFLTLSSGSSCDAAASKPKPAAPSPPARVFWRRIGDDLRRWHAPNLAVARCG